ncbi:MAG TPA: MFS transporter, partial [Devosiaceae bacterium]|nr:MFS transporter [Devosiaceae bacterium]
QMPVTVPGAVTPPRREPTPAPRSGVATTMRQTWQAWYVLPLIGVALLHGSHMMQLGFGALIWTRAGIPTEVVGPLWAVAPVSEIVIMIYFTRIARRFSARHLLLVCCAAGVVRWAGFAMEPGIWGLAALQTLNMATMGLSFLGAVNFIANWTGEGIAAQSQAVAVVFRQIASVAVLIGAGFLVAWFGAGAFWASAALAALAAACIYASLVLRPPGREGIGKADRAPRATA